MREHFDYHTYLYQHPILFLNIKEYDSMIQPVFVFGSNLAGRHGKGAALWAKQYRGALYGVGQGPQGNSYAIPTKGYNLEILPLDRIEYYVNIFLNHARESTDTFRVTPIGCGLAGYRYDQIAPMFKGAPVNAVLPPEFTSILTSHFEISNIK
jgi:hypothetical protein